MHARDPNAQTPKNAIDTLYTLVHSNLIIRLIELILPIHPNILQFRKVLEMHRAMHTIIKPDGRIESDMHRLLLNRSKRAAHETVIPNTVVRHEEISSNLIREQELTLLSERGREARGIIRHGVFILGTPLVAVRGEGPGTKGYRTGREADGH
jgi:hypothetical protein